VRPLLAVFLPLLVAYGVTLRWIYDIWSLPDSYYSHGPLLPFVAAVVLWLRRARWRGVPAVPDGRAWWLLALALILHLAGAALMVDSLSAASLVLALPAAVWLAFGAARTVAILPVVLLVVFAVPLPMFVSGRLAFELKEVAVGSALTVCGWIGVEVSRVGANLFVPPQAEPLVVADACSGLRSLIALVTIGYCVAFFLGSQRGARRWVILAAAVPIACVTNVLRIVAICVVARSSGVAYATGVAHDLANVFEWGVDLALLLSVDIAWSRLGGDE